MVGALDFRSEVAGGGGAVSSNTPSCFMLQKTG